MTLKTRINIAAVISIILVATILLVLGKLSENLVEIRFQEASLTGKSALWKKIISSQYDHMEANTNIITRDRDSLKAIKNADKTELEGMNTTYILLSSSNVISKLQIADLNGQVLFSAPNSFEGSTRKILHSRVLTEGKVMRGIERDDDNKLYINFAFPVYYRGKPIGVASYMRDLQSAIEDFKHNDNSDTFIINDNGNPESSTDKNLLELLDFDLPALGSQSMAVAKHNGVIY
ncbi:MAG: cache domain-containing protein, partial [Gammaproteobacteria bacterium]|nr:cache domain-containing protein [Gammaproteobacteria bacterium]